MYSYVMCSACTAFRAGLTSVIGKVSYVLFVTLGNSRLESWRLC